MFHVAGNIALHKPAMQSSTFYGYIASLAVDGNADAQHCSKTQYTYEPWWAVDLQTRYTLLSISLTYPHWTSTSMRLIHSWLIYWNILYTWGFLSHFDIYEILSTYVEYQFSFNTASLLIIKHTKPELVKHTLIKVTEHTSRRKAI